MSAKVDLMSLTPKDLAQRSRELGQHPRSLLVPTAKAAMAYAVYRVEAKYDLTAIELVQCLADVIQGSMKYALRMERHGDPEYPADAPPASKRKKAVRS
jgi:hypothetical protein